MIESFNYLFHYLEKERTTIDKSEFIFQIQSHPDYPSLLSVSDTLSFLNIENIAITISFSEIELLPNQFVALLNDGDNNSELYLIEKKDSEYLYLKNNKFRKITKADLEKKWKNIVLLITPSEFEASFKNKNKKNWILLFIVSVVLTIQLLLSTEIIFLKLFLILPFIGILFSIAAFKDLFETKSKIINDICSISTTTNCSSIIKTDKWKLFERINYSDLSIVFFTSQLIVLLVSIFFDQGIESFYFQKIVLYFSIPFLFLSLYYQKFVEKKWCPICLIIATTLILEIIILQFLRIKSFYLLNEITFFGLVFFTFYIVWKNLKQVLIDKKELKETQLKSIRFERRYQLFKAKLLTENKIILPTNSIVLGNKNAKINILIISNPFCGYCKEVHFMLDRILEKNKEKLNISIILRTNLDLLDDNSKKLFRGLFELFLNKEDVFFSEALRYWFENLDIDKWLEIYYTESDFKKTDELLQLHFNWTNENEYRFTPAIFINGYEYPQIYDRKNLEFFINEIIEDEQFN